MRITDYIRDTKAELKHVTWPTRNQAIAYTVAVIGISLGLAILLGGFDVIFSYLIKYIVSGY